MQHNLLALALAALFYYVLMHSTVLDKEYHTALVRLYGSPLFRFALLGLLLWAFSWSNTIGVVIGLVIVFYYADVGYFTEPQSAPDPQPK
jgi:hypothetical protein